MKLLTLYTIIILFDKKKHMTFIASVLARDGVAIIADSFVTRQEVSMSIRDFLHHLREKGDNSLSSEELTNLFIRRPHSTRNYANKLFKLDIWTAITTTGKAYINSKIISDLIDLFVAKHTGLDEMPINEKIQNFIDFIKAEIIEHLSSDQAYFEETVFIISHYNTIENKPQIFKITFHDITRDEYFADTDKVFWSNSDETSLKLVCDGQNRISDRLLFGTLYGSSTSIISKIALKVLDECNIQDEQKRNDIISSLFDGQGILFDEIAKDFEIFKIRELSLQEAVNLAGLLMRVVMDFQLYTENVPTVGGVIKIATIDKVNKFKYIAGHEIVSPSL